MTSSPSTSNGMLTPLEEPVLTFGHRSQTKAQKECSSTCTLPPERTQPQKLCTASFSSGTLKTLINRLLRLKNKIFWRAPCEKKPFFSWLKSDSQKYILKWSYWPEILAPGLKLIFVTTLFSNFFHFTQPLPSWLPPLKWGKGGIFALLAQNDPKLTSHGLKWPQ